MKKGFTLIELLVVIAILAVLMSVVVVTINPAEMLKKTRDTKRISDLDALRTALNLYVTDVGSLRPFSGGGDFVTSACYSHLSVSTSSLSCSTLTVTTSQAINGNGWIPLNFATITSGSPLSALPVDPTSKDGDNGVGPGGWHAYVFKGSTASTTFKLMANMESTYYSKDGTGDVEKTDGGASDEVYEIGSDVSGL
ncbi:MAG: type II secretion system protein [Candidatus Pacebacteria bacterium]|nr:type II secretion system protein [Candidatus Paceibacterota bacterium]